MLILRNQSSIRQQVHRALHGKAAARTESHRIGSLLLTATGTKHSLAPSLLLALRAWILRRSRQSCRNCLLGQRADKCIYQFAIFEDQHGRDAANSEAAGGLRVFVYVQFGDQVTSVSLGCQFVEYRRDHSTGSAPWRPTIDQDWRRASVQNFLFKTGVSNYARPAAVCRSTRLPKFKRLAETPTDGPLCAGLSLVDSILCLTSRTMFNHRLTPFELAVSSSIVAAAPPW